MSIEKMNPNEGSFKFKPEDMRNPKGEEEERLRKKVEDANKKLRQETETKKQAEKEANFEFLRDFPDLWVLVDEYEEKLGNAFLEQKEDIITTLREFVEKKTKVNFEDEKEMNIIRETLEKNLEKEVNERISEAA